MTEEWAQAALPVASPPPAVRPGALEPPATWHLLEEAPNPQDDTPVVSLGAWCELVDLEDEIARLRAAPLSDALREEEIGFARRRIAFDVSEFAVLADGRCLTLHAERGFARSTDPDDRWAHVTRDGVIRDVLTTVLPDVDEDGNETGDDHPWEWLVLLLAVHGIRTTAAHLRTVPYVVELSDRLETLLAEGGR